MIPTARAAPHGARPPRIHAPALRKDIDIPVVVSGRETGAEQRDIFDVSIVPSSVDFQGSVESVALAHESQIEVSLWEGDRRMAAMVVPVRAGTQAPVHLRGIPTRNGIHEIRVLARVGAASVRGRIQVEAVAP